MRVRGGGYLNPMRYDISLIDSFWSRSDYAAVYVLLCRVSAVALYQVAKVVCRDVELLGAPRHRGDGALACVHSGDMVVEQLVEARGYTAIFGHLLLALAVVVSHTQT